MSSELVLIIIIAMIVFGPNKLPMLARHLSHALKQFNALKQQAANIWQGYLNEIQLQDNQQKAKLADQQYQLVDAKLSDKTQHCRMPTRE